MEGSKQGKGSRQLSSPGMGGGPGRGEIQLGVRSKQREVPAGERSRQGAGESPVREKKVIQLIPSNNY